MYRIEKNVETYEGRLFSLKSCLQQYPEILYVSENKIYCSFFKKINTYKARVLSMRYLMYFRAFYILTLYSLDIYNFLYFISMFVVK